MSDAFDSSPRHLEAQAAATCDEQRCALGHGQEALAANSCGDVAPAIGLNLRRLRLRRGLSLERLSRQSRVSRAMLSQIELGRSAPSVNVVWRIASALAVPFSALLSLYPTKAPRVLHAHKAQLTSNHDGSFCTRALFPRDREPSRASEFFQLTIKPHASGSAAAYAPQTTANIVLASGCVAVKLGSSSMRLQEGDAALFDADVEQVYENVGDKLAVLYLVITYPSLVDGFSAKAL